MPDKPLKLPIRPQSSRREIVANMNRAFETSDIAAICHAIRSATRLHNISDIASRAGMERPSIYRAFGCRQSPNLSTLLGVLDAMGFPLKVTQRGGERARARNSRLKRVAKAAGLNDAGRASLPKSKTKPARREAF